VPTITCVNMGCCPPAKIPMGFHLDLDHTS
jgi:hypothetical protein